MTDRTKERIRDFVFFAVGGAGTLVSLLAVLVKHTELRACLMNTSARYPLEKYPDFLADFIFSIIILALFSAVFALPLIRKNMKRLEPIISFVVGAAGSVCFAKILISVAGIIEYNSTMEPHLNIIRTYWIAIFGSTIPFLFFVSLLVFSFCSLIKRCRQ